MKYFILSPFSRDGAHSEASIAGVRAYADAIRETNPQMAADLADWLENSPLKPTNTY